MTDVDNEDLVEIIQKVLPSNPKFKLLLESQLCNCTAKDPRSRRWHPDVISLCLNLWAKYDLFSYHVLILLLQTIFILHRFNLYQILVLFCKVSSCLPGSETIWLSYFALTACVAVP